jgi:hypothetical protein
VKNRCGEKVIGISAGLYVLLTKFSGYLGGCKKYSVERSRSSVNISITFDKMAGEERYGAL